MELEERIDEMITELLNDLYIRIRDSDTDFDEQVSRITELSEIENTIKAKLTPDEYARYDEAIGLRHERDLRMQKEAYMQGAKDCVTMLRKVGVL